jgi:outer membrane protein OmpA-like peptidoglycan-associated protein
MTRVTLRIRLRALLLLLLLISSTLAVSQDIKVEGLIVGRNGDEMVVKPEGGEEVTFLLTLDTEVSQMKEISKPRRPRMYEVTLIPGLKVQVEGTHNAENHLIAIKVNFKDGDLQQAKAMQAGVQGTKMQAQANMEELQEQSEALQAQNQALQLQQAQITDQQAKIAANKAAIAANTARFGQLDDYYIFDELTVYFGNGKVKVDPKYEAQLVALAEKAKGVEGYVIEVKGYTSSQGDVATNQKLSKERASQVMNILLQKGHVPVTRMLAPGAIGEAHQVGNTKTAEGQAENRRVVVWVLQNKAIAGS